MSQMLKKDQKAALTEKLAHIVENGCGFNVAGLKFVRVQHGPGDAFFHYICDDEQGGRHYLEVAVRERI